MAGTASVRLVGVRIRLVVELVRPQHHAIGSAGRLAGYVDRHQLMYTGQHSASKQRHRQRGRGHSVYRQRGSGIIIENDLVLVAVRSAGARIVADVDEVDRDTDGIDVGVFRRQCGSTDAVFEMHVVAVGAANIVQKI